MTAARCYRRTVVLLLVLFAPALIACGQLGQQPQLRVVATLAPFADWARQVGGERVSVTQLVPTGVDPRTWEPSATDLQHLSEADVVLFNGLGLEPWLELGDRAERPDRFRGTRDRSGAGVWSIRCTTATHQEQGSATRPGYAHARHT